MNNEKIIKDLRDSITILENNIESFHKGVIPSYKVIASQLRLLLCPGRGNNLIARIISNVKLHPVKGYISNNEAEQDESKRKIRALRESAVFISPARILFDGKGGSRVEILFDESREVINLEEWLGQPLFNKSITILGLIESTANKEAVHSDNDYDDTLNFVKSVKLVNQDMHIKYLVAIGEYILKYTRQQFELL